MVLNVETDAKINNSPFPASLRFDAGGDDGRDTGNGPLPPPPPNIQGRCSRQETNSGTIAEM